MSKKKGHRPAPASPSKSSTASSGSQMTRWLIVAIVAVAVAGGVAVAARGKSAAIPGSQPTPAAAANGGALVAPAEEAKYIGRFLPKGYEETSVTAPGAITADTPMKPVVASAEGDGLAIALADVTASRNVSFEYQKPDGTKVPLIAYVKPSGKIFVGVSYCVPCKGTGQTLTADGELTCTSCGTKRDPETGIGVSGACKLYPLDELPAKIQGDKLVVDGAALGAWAQQPLDRQVGG